MSLLPFFQSIVQAKDVPRNIHLSKILVKNELSCGAFWPFLYYSLGF